MASWPSGNKPSATTTDADADSISGARVDLNKTVANQSEIIDMFNIPASPTDDYILVYNASQNRFDVEENTAGFDGNLNGADLTDSTGELDIVNSRINIKPNTTDDRKISMGDETFLSPNYLLTSATISGAEERWAFLFLDEHSNGSFPKTLGTTTNFTNPTIAGRVQGGTPGSEVGVKSGGRLLSFQAFAGQDDDGAGTNYALPSGANFRIMGETTEVQRTSGNGGRGTKLRIDTIATGSQSSVISADIQGTQFRIAPDESSSTLKGGGEFNIESISGHIVLNPNSTNEIRTEGVTRLGVNSSGTITEDVFAANYVATQFTVGSTGAGEERGVTIFNKTINIDSPSGTDDDLLLFGANAGTVKVNNLEIQGQATGTPSNTTTPTGYIQIDINGTTRYMPYYTQEKKMAFPTGVTVPTTNLATAADSPASARADLLSLTQNTNLIIGSYDSASGICALDASGLVVNTKLPDALQSSSGNNITLNPNTGVVKVNNLIELTPRTKAQLLALTGVAGQVSFCSDGDGGDPCLAVYQGTVWKVCALTTTITQYK